MLFFLMKKVQQFSAQIAKRKKKETMWQNSNVLHQFNNLKQTVKHGGSLIIWRSCLLMELKKWLLLKAK